MEISLLIVITWKTDLSFFYSLRWLARNNMCLWQKQLMITLLCKVHQWQVILKMISSNCKSGLWIFLILFERHSMITLLPWGITSQSSQVSSELVSIDSWYRQLFSGFIYKGSWFLFLKLFHLITWSGRRWLTVCLFQLTSISRIVKLSILFRITIWHSQSHEIL